MPFVSKKLVAFTHLTMFWLIKVCTPAKKAMTVKFLGIGKLNLITALSNKMIPDLEADTEREGEGDDDEEPGDG